MKAELALLTVLTLVPMASAEEMKSEVSREQRDVQIDGQTGEVHKQHEIQKDTVKKDTTAGQTRVEREHKTSGTVSSENVHGDRDAVNAQDSTKTSVTTHPDGVHIEQKQQHSEQVISE